MENILEYLSLQLNNATWLAPLIVLLAGVLTSISPCSLSTLPLTIGYISGTSNNHKKAFKFSIIIALGMSISFTVMGVIATLLGSLVGKGNTIWYLLIGILMMLMTLQIWEIFEFIPSTYLNSKTNKKGYLGAIIVGILSGIFSSPCSTPILIILLAMVANSDSIISGIILLLLYSIGNSFFTIIGGTFTGLVRKISCSSKYGIFSKISKIFLGIISLGFGLYMFYLAF